jgi:hypothetical protein
MRKWLYFDPLGVTREFNSIEDFPPNTVGFIYKIVNLINGKFYIGRKVLFNNTNKALTKKEIAEWDKPGRVPRKKKIIKESDWLLYHGSNKLLNQERKEIGDDMFAREILQLCYSKKQLTYYEVWWQMHYKVLHIDSYNDNIQGRFYRKDVE